MYYRTGGNIASGSSFQLRRFVHYLFNCHHQHISFLGSESAIPQTNDANAIYALRRPLRVRRYVLLFVHSYFRSVLTHFRQPTSLASPGRQNVMLPRAFVAYNRPLIQEGHDNSVETSCSQPMGLRPCLAGWESGYRRGVERPPRGSPLYRDRIVFRAAMMGFHLMNERLGGIALQAVNLISRARFLYCLSVLLHFSNKNCIS